MKKSYIYAGVTVLIWSTLATVVKLVLQDIPNLQALTISSAFAFVFLLILNIINGSIKEMKSYKVRDYLTMSGLGFLGLFMYSAFLLLRNRRARLTGGLYPQLSVAGDDSDIRLYYPQRKVYGKEDHRYADVIRGNRGAYARQRRKRIG